MWSESGVPMACQPLPSFSGRMRWTSVTPPVEPAHRSQMNWPLT